MKAKLLPLLFMGLFIACNQNPYKQGARLYDLYCSNCHMEDGQGMEGLYPPLAHPIFEEYRAKFACIVNQGISDTLVLDGNEFVFPMPGNKELNNVEISNIYNFIVHKWHPHLEAVSAKAVKLDLERCTD